MKYRYIKKILKNRDFVISLACYPTALLLYLILKSYLRHFEFRANTGFWYSFLIFGGFATFIVVTVFERVERVIFYKGQGDKLKMKQKENTWRK